MDSILEALRGVFMTLNTVYISGGHGEEADATKACSVQMLQRRMALPRTQKPLKAEAEIGDTDLGKKVEAPSVASSHRLLSHTRTMPLKKGRTLITPISSRIAIM